MVVKLQGNCFLILKTASNTSLPAASQARPPSQATCKQAQSIGNTNGSPSGTRRGHWIVTNGWKVENRRKEAPVAEVWERLRMFRHDDSGTPTTTRVGFRGGQAPDVVKKLERVEAEIEPSLGIEVSQEELTSLLPPSPDDVWDRSSRIQSPPWPVEVGKGNPVDPVLGYEEGVGLNVTKTTFEGRSNTWSSGEEQQGTSSSAKLPLPFSVNLTTQQSILLMNLLSFGYGANAVLVKLMQDHEGVPLVVPASTQITVDFFARFVVATLCFLPPTLARHKALRAQRKASPAISAPMKKASQPTALWGKLSGLVQGIAPGLELGFWMFLSYAGQTIGLESSTADHAELLATVAVILVPFLEAFGGRPISKPVWAATLIACSGMLLLEGGPSLVDGGGLGTSLGIGSSSIPAGDWWCLLSAVCAAIHVVRSEVLTYKYDSLWLVTSQLAFTAVASLAWVAWEVNSQHIPFWNLAGCLPAVPWAIILLTGPLGTGMCEWLELEALHHVPASTATLITTTVPIWGCLLAYFLLGETLDATSMAGASLILLASVSVQLLSSSSSSSNEEGLAHEQHPESDIPIAPLALLNIDGVAASSEFAGRRDVSLTFAPVRVTAVSPTSASSRVLSTNQAIGTVMAEDGVVGLDSWSRKFDLLPSWERHMRDPSRDMECGSSGRSDMDHGDLDSGNHVTLMNSLLRSHGIMVGKDEPRQAGSSSPLLTKRWRGGSLRSLRRR